MVSKVETRSLIAAMFSERVCEHGSVHVTRYVQVRTWKIFKPSDIAATTAFGPVTGQASSAFSAMPSIARMRAMAMMACSARFEPSTGGGMAAESARGAAGDEATAYALWRPCASEMCRE
jgi:hypothetical protein